jgi:tetratricopeptide (TPR) repeat protein
MKKPQWDVDLEKAVGEFEREAVAAKVRVESIHPFDKELFKEQLREQLHSFYTDIQKGYEVLVHTVLDLSAQGIGLGGREPLGIESMKAVKHLFPDQEVLETLSEEDAQNWIEQGKPLYEVFGLTNQAMATLYEAACYLLKQDRDDEARTGFRLLLALAPHIADFWVGYGVCLIRLKESHGAVDALERALSLDPGSTEALLLLCRALVEANRRSEAEARLNERIDIAAREANKERYELLESARFELSKFAVQGGV